MLSRLMLQQYEADLAKGEDFGYDMQLESILVNHIQEVVSATMFHLQVCVPVMCGATHYTCVLCLLF